jgi:lipid-binding SYLF domain-containing protein
MSHDPLNPKYMEGFIGNGIHALETVKGVPKILFEKCAAVVLLSSREMAFFLFTDQKGAGVAMRRTGDDTWSNPIPVVLKGSGVGLALGVADKQVLILLNSEHADQLLEGGQGGIKVDFQLGFAVGKVGADTGAGVAAAPDKPLAASVIYTHSKGAFVGGELQGCAITKAPDVMQSFYGTSDTKAITDGNAKVPKEDEFVAKLHEAVKKYEQK